MLVSFQTSLVTLVLGVMTSTAACAMQSSFGHRMGFQGAGRRGQFQQWLQNHPVTLPPGARQVQNVAYGSDPAQRLDVYIPAKAHDAPVILMVHGGGWRRGDKAMPGVVQNKVDYFLPKGYIFISTNYRFVPEVNVLTEADDIAHALAYAQQHATEWGGNPSKFVLMGHSAGAHLVALVSSAPSIWKNAGARPWLGTVALDSAAYDVVEIMNRRHFDLYDTAFGSDPKLWQAVSPIHRLETAPPPMLLVCSSERSDSCGPARAFAEKAQSLKGRVTVLPVDLDHGKVNSSVGTPGTMTDRIEGFMKSLGLN